MVSEPACGSVRSGFRIFVCYGGFAHQRTTGKFFESGERNEYRDADGNLRDLFGGRVDCAELCGACVGDWRRGVHGSGDRWSHFAGSEDGVPCGVHAISTTDGIADRRDHFYDRDWGHTEPDEYGPAEIRADPNSGERGSVGYGRESGEEFDYISGEELRFDQRAGFGADRRRRISLRSGD